MALDFVKTNTNYLSYGISGLSALINGTSKYAVSALIRPDSYSATSPTNNENCVFRLMVNGTTNVLTLRVDLVVGTPRVHVTARSVAADSAQNVTGTTADLATGSWHQIGALLDIAGDSIAPVADGVIDNESAVTFGSSTVVIGTPTEPDRIGAHSATPPNTTDQFDGIIAECAIWDLGSGDTDSDFTSEEWLGLADGLSPLLIRPRRLVFYAPLLKSVDDRISGVKGTITGSLDYIDHPRVYMPTRKKLYALRTGTRELSFSASLSRTVALQREGQVNRAVIVKRTARKTSVASRLFSALIGRTAAVDVNLPDLFQHVLSAAVSRTASVSLMVFQGTRKFIGSAGLGIVLSPKRRWDRRPRRR